jgi:hypothetical protein
MAPIDGLETSLSALVTFGIIVGFVVGVLISFGIFLLV